LKILHIIKLNKQQNLTHEAHIKFFCKRMIDNQYQLSAVHF